VKDEPLVSVVVPTFNSERFLERCLASVRAQTCSNIEVIAVDNYSTDKTKGIAERYQAKIISSSAKRSEARNIGAKEAEGACVFFVDSDMELGASVVDECLRKIDMGYDGIIVPEFSVGEGFWAECKALEKSLYVGDDLIEAARFFRKSVFENVGGYDLDLEAGEDWGLNQKIRKSGCRIGRIEAIVYHHEGRLSLHKTMQKKRYYGKTLKRYAQKHPEDAKKQLRPIRLAFARGWRKLARDPTHAFGMFVMKTCEYAVTMLSYR
jgi:glycosyltransferase involved in cell wall biosynthesis